MLKRKSVKTRGKISFKNFFQEFKKGDKVAVVKEHSIILGYSHRIQGRTGTVIAKQGEAYHVEINDHDKAKRYFIKPIHLKRIEGAQ
jgi:large subunit ribosomal protein L21e